MTGMGLLLMLNERIWAANASFKLDALNPGYSERRTATMVKRNTRIRHAESTHNPNPTARVAVSLIAASLTLMLALGVAVKGQPTSKTDPNQVAVSLLMVPKAPHTSDLAIPEGTIPKLSQAPTLKGTSAPANRLRMLEALGAAEQPTVPVNATELITLPKLSALEIF
jgi:hypothetical protein